jgi:hypothetical protein
MDRARAAVVVAAVMSGVGIAGFALAVASLLLLAR